MLLTHDETVSLAEMVEDDNVLASILSKVVKELDEIERRHDREDTRSLEASER